MRSQIMRVALAAALAAVIASAAQAQQAAQGYPNRSIKMILPFAAGGAGDTFARPLAQALSQSLGQPVVIENIVGAAAVIGTQVAARAPADGYTLLMVSNALAIAETMSPKRGYVLMREFTPLTQLNALSLVLVVNPKMQVKNVAELVAMAKAQPGKLNYASSGVGSIYHLPMEHLKSMAGIDLQHVPYKSSSQARMDVIAGEPSMMMDALATMQGQIKANQLRATRRREPEANRNRAGPAGHRGNRSRLFGRRLARLHGASRHAAGDRQQTAAGDREGAGAPGREGRLSRAGCRAGRQHAGGVRQVPQRGNRQVGQSDPQRRHSTFRTKRSRRCKTKARTAGPGFSLFDGGSKAAAGLN